MLLKRDRANPAPAEEDFRTAIAIAKEQGSRSFELRAALALDAAAGTQDAAVEEPGVSPEIPFHTAAVFKTPNAQRHLVFAPPTARFALTR